VLEEKYGIEYDAKHHRIRCTGHIFSLSANDFMFVDNENTLAEDNNLPALLRGCSVPDKKAMRLWRKTGPPGKCHDFTVSVSSSPQLRQKWIKMAGRYLPRDNSTRWGSWRVMIEVFIFMREPYEKWWTRYPDEFLASIKLTNDDWDQLIKLHHFLTALDDALKFLEGPKATLERVLPTMEFVLEHFEQGKVRLDIILF
jgi:hypothetical protein